MTHKAMPARLVVVAFAVVGFFLSVAGATTVASNSTEEYFALMRAYLGRDGFARHPCLAEQEKHGWVSNKEHQKRMGVFTWGTEGVGHHAFKTLLGPRHPAFDTLKGDGGQHSVPSNWRRKQRVTKLGTHDNPDVAAQVESGSLLIFAIRYPPVSLLSAVNRFQGFTGKYTEHEKACNAVITGCDELFTLHDSLLYIENVLRYPDFDCGRMIIVPYALLTQRPLSLFGPLSQAMQLREMGQDGFNLLETRLRAIEAYKNRKTTSGNHYDIMEAMCTDLGISQTTNIVAPPASVQRLAAAVKAQDPDFLNQSCADRLYTFAETYFDERRYMFPGVYPSQALIKASRNKHPGSGLHFDDLLAAEPNRQ